MEEESPRHLRRRSMPASFSNFQQRAPKSITGNAANNYVVDKFAVLSNWSDFENWVLSRKTASSNIRQDEDEWKASLGLKGDMFWGYSSSFSEDAFFRSRLQGKWFFIQLFLATLVAMQLHDFFGSYDDAFSLQLSFIGLAISGLFAILLLTHRIRKEQHIAFFLAAIGIVQCMHSLAYVAWFRTGGIPDFIYVNDERASTARKRTTMMLFCLVLGSALAFGIRPSYTMGTGIVFAIISQLPTFFFFASRTFYDHREVEIFITVIGPVYYMIFGAVLLGLLSNRSERLDFEQKVMKFHMKCKVIELKEITSHSQNEAPKGGSNTSLPLGSFDSLSNMVQESIMDRGINAFLKLQKEYSVRRNQTMQVLIEICVSALALTFKGAKGVQSNWTEFFIKPGEKELTRPSPVLERNFKRGENGKIKSPSQRTPRRRRHSVVTIDPTNDGGSSPMLNPVQMIGPQPRKRSSSTDQLANATRLFPFDISTLADYDPSAIAALEKDMRDWNFGSGCGIWSRLFSDDRFSKPRYSQPLTVVTIQALTKFGLFESNELGVDENVCRQFLQLVEASYLPREKVPYHNAIHACDVVQTVFSMLCMDPVPLTDLALFALLISAAVHDVAHPGLNNSHLIASQHELAVTYNDRSVLENFHVSKAFSIMLSDPKYDILAKMKAEGKEDPCQLFRSFVVEMVLATDLQYHYDQQAKFRILTAEQQNQRSNTVKASMDEEDADSRERTNSDCGMPVNKKLEFVTNSDQSLVCSTLLHAADISNVAKDWKSYEPWKRYLFQEFFAQGDLERSRGQEVQPMMDRNQSNPANSQIYFITKMVMPLYQVLAVLIPRTCEVAVIEMEANVEKLRESGSPLREQNGPVKPSDSS